MTLFFFKRPYLTAPIYINTDLIKVLYWEEKGELVWPYIEVWGGEKLYFYPEGCSRETARKLLHELRAHMGALKLDAIEDCESPRWKL